MKAIPVGKEVALYPLTVYLEGSMSSQIGLAISAHVAICTQVRELAAFFIMEGLNKLLVGSLF